MHRSASLRFVVLFLFYALCMTALVATTLQGGTRRVAVQAYFMSPRSLQNAHRLDPMLFGLLELLQQPGIDPNVVPYEQLVAQVRRRPIRRLVSDGTHFNVHLQADAQQDGVFPLRSWRIDQWNYAILMRTVAKCQEPHLESSAQSEAVARSNLTSICYRQAVGDLDYYYEQQAVLTDGSLLLNSVGEVFKLPAESGDRFVDVACGRAASVAVTEQGRVYVWGDRSKKLPLDGPTKPRVLDAFNGQKVVSHGGASSFYDSDSTFAFVTEDGTLWVSAPSFDTSNRSMLPVPGTFSATDSIVRVADFDKFFVFNRNSLDYTIVKITGNATMALGFDISQGTIKAEDLGVAAGSLPFKGINNVVLSDFGSYGLLLLADDMHSLLYMRMNISSFFGGPRRQRVDSTQYTVEFVDLSATLGADAKFSAMSVVHAKYPYGNGIVLHDARDGAAWVLGYPEKLLWEPLTGKQTGFGIGIGILFCIPLILAGIVVSVLTCVRNRTPVQNRLGFVVSLGLKAAFCVYACLYVLVHLIRAVYIVDAGFNGAQITICNTPAIAGVIVVMLLPILFTYLVAIPITMIRCCKARRCEAKPATAANMMAYALMFDLLFTIAFIALGSAYMATAFIDIPAWLPVVWFVLNWISGTAFLVGSALSMESWLAVPWLVKRIEKIVDKVKDQQQNGQQSSSADDGSVKHAVLEGDGDGDADDLHEVEMDLASNEDQV